MPNNPSKALSLNDDPSLEDAFQSEFINRLCPIIKDCQPPKGMAITGYWGAGKTSALRQMYFHLSNELPPGCNQDDPRPHSAKFHDETLVPVWFEAWRYQHETQPVVALLNEIRVKMGLLQKFATEGKKLAGVTLLGALNVFDEIIKMASGGFSTNSGKIMEVGEKWESDRYMDKLPSQKISDFLEQAIDKALGKVKNRSKRLLIFIDDLDRCLPTAALRLLEGIKIYLNLRNCIFVFGMDHRQLQESLLASLPWIEKTDSSDRRRAAYFAQEYLEKICQDIHYLPIPSKNDKAAYFTKLLDALNLGTQDNITHSNKLRTILLKHDCLPANPRKIKMLANRTALTLRSVPPTGEGQTPEAIDRQYKILLVMTIIYTFFKPVHEQLESNPAYINEVITYADTSGDQILDARFQPMAGIVSTKGETGGRLPVNPSDSNVFRIHEMLAELQAVTEDEIKPFLRLKR